MEADTEDKMALIARVVDLEEEVNRLRQRVRVLSAALTNLSTAAISQPTSKES